MCDKEPYHSLAEARQTAHGMSRQHNQTMEPYQCNECGGWHLRTAGKRKRKRNNNKYPFRFHGKIKKKK